MSPEPQHYEEYTSATQTAQANQTAQRQNIKNTATEKCNQRAKAAKDGIGYTTVGYILHYGGLDHLYNDDDDSARYVSVSVLLKRLILWLFGGSM